jgi:hypothetical protein
MADRFLTENAAWSTQIRAQQAVAVGNVRRLKEQVERLTVHKVGLQRRELTCRADSDPGDEFPRQLESVRGDVLRRVIGVGHTMSSD